ncbi:uncharacterized protein LOC120216290 [Hibiscus syriacus]|uniref:uncharacterized protein LOC120216290 n=1 Tax=Hibiscus syriacus TaxID=106335 RepID=UPI00192388E4|nr:uncharacterized protein LOC120216290 [Hibiscus syriacus]
MDDLAMALKEVKAEADETNEKFLFTNLELENTKGEVQNLKLQLRSMEEKYIESKKQRPKGHPLSFASVSNRVRGERASNALNSLIHREKKQWPPAELTAEFTVADVKDYRRGEQQRTVVAEAKRSTAADVRDCRRGEQQRTAAAEAKGSTDNENLKINEATTVDNIRDLKLLLCDANCEADDPERVKKQKAAANSVDKDHKDYKEQQGKKSKHNISKSACLNLSFPNYKNKDADDDSKLPQRTPSTSSSNHQRKKSSLTGDEAMNGEEFEPVDKSNFDEEIDRSSRKKKALLKRFDDLIRRKSFKRLEQASD